MDRKWLVLHMQCFSSYQLPSLTTQLSKNWPLLYMYKHSQLQGQLRYVAAEGTKIRKALGEKHETISLFCKSCSKINEQQVTCSSVYFLGILFFPYSYQQCRVMRKMTGRGEVMNEGCCFVSFDCACVSARKCSRQSSLRCIKHNSL